MALKDILVHLDGGARSSVRLAIAVALARRHSAHLTGIYVVDIPQADYLYGASMPFAGSGPEQIIAQMRADAVAGASATEAAFREALSREGIEGEWRLAEGDTPNTLALHARYADLLILGQPNRSSTGSAVARDGVVVAALMSSGRPVLAIPYAGDFPRLGDHVLVAWNAGREATRAVNDALPLLQEASKVTVLAINPRGGIGGHGDVPAADISLHLARHGVRAVAAHTIAKDISDGEALLSYAADIDADMLVCGGYGHSRARELVFGGVTRTLLHEMTIPVFLSH